jgi:hypothetical protein
LYTCSRVADRKPFLPDCLVLLGSQEIALRTKLLTHATLPSQKALAMAR